MIGHVKAEHRMGRNYLAGKQGDAVNAILAAAGYNFSLLLRWLKALLWLLLAAVPWTEWLTRGLIVLAEDTGRRIRTRVTRMKSCPALCRRIVGVEEVATRLEKDTRLS